MPLTFLADTMLGRLARWLRLLGYDTAYSRVLPDSDLIVQLLREGRWLLTRDGYLARRRAVRNRVTLLRSDSVDDQLRQLRAELRIELTLGDGNQPRCAACNLVLEPVAPEAAASRVPPYVAGHFSAFAQCPGCRRVYWPGTHWIHMGRRLERLRRHGQGA